MDGITCVYLSALMHLSKVLQQEKDWLTLKVIELYFYFLLYCYLKVYWTQFVWKNGSCSIGQHFLVFPYLPRTVSCQRGLLHLTGTCLKKCKCSSNTILIVYNIRWSAKEEQTIKGHKNKTNTESYKFRPVMLITYLTLTLNY